jgi:U32 family peptidase
MSKIIVIPNKISDIDLIIDNCDAIILGIKDFSVNYREYVTIEELKDLINKYSNKEIFVSINKIFHNNEILELEQLLIELNKLKIKGILYYDIAIINIYKRLNLMIPLVWHQNHLVTNYNTINYWYNEGAKYAYLSPEITLNEIIDIKNNTNCPLIVPIFGYLPMMFSKRKLISNYLNYIHEQLNDNNYQLFEKQRREYYPVIEDQNGTTIYSSHILNGLEEYIALLSNNIEYAVLNAIDIDINNFIEVLIIYNQIRNSWQNNKIDMTYTLHLSNKIDMLLKNTDKGFLYKETIYKVKNDEE